VKIQLQLLLLLLLLRFKPLITKTLKNIAKNFVFDTFRVDNFNPNQLQTKFVYYTSTMPTL
jgi:hypothetical protein